MVSDLDLWIEELRNDGKSPKTVAAYVRDIRLMEELTGKPIARASRDELVGAIARYRSRPDPRFRKHRDQAPAERAPATVGRVIAALRQYCRWLEISGRIEKSPARDLKTPKRARRLLSTLDLDTARQLPEEASRGRWPERDYLLLLLALTTGLRLAEIVSVASDDVHEDFVRVIGKGNKERRVPLVAATKAALEAYLPTRQATLERLGAKSDALFISSRARKARAELSQAGVAYIIERTLAALGARTRGNRVHVLRRTFATLGLRPDPETGQSPYTIRQLQQILGHANLASLHLYTEVSEDEVMRAAERHPLARPSAAELEAPVD